MSLAFHQVDAFSDRPFAGNPAMVYRLEQWLDEALMQRIAAEHNLSETVFVVREGDRWRIRWFTPNCEVPLCGHATLAAAHVLFEVYGEPAPVLQFDSLSGPLAVTRQGDWLELDFPTQAPLARAVDAELQQLVGQPLQAAFTTRELMVVLESEAAVRACQPDLNALAQWPFLGLIVTAPGEQHDFVSRYFAPALGVDEDPVTGSIHCSLIPYWAERLGKTELAAFQCSNRGGELRCRLEGERVKIAGQARRVASGELLI